ncbi:putative holin-like toxin [Mammaliicoccus sp. P-M59]|uniref:putative holin-like toxin n=1 Tax=Mammaliicoccus sp. P-M59 TaxID=2898718 RepID=UPI001EFA4F53
MFPIGDALNLMFSFSTFDVLLLGLVIAIVKMNQKMAIYNFDMLNGYFHTSIIS